MSFPYKLGLTPSPADRPKLIFDHYFPKHEKIQVPTVFGHQDKVSSWGMLGNDRYGDCAWASSAHEVMVQNAANGRTVNFTDANVLSDYSAGTGFNENDPSTDQGTNMYDLYQYRLKTGIVDSTGTRHKLAAFMEIEPTSQAELAAAAYTLGVAGIGIKVYDWAQQQFADGQAWSYKRGGNLEGGHAIPVVGRNAAGNWLVVTWGQIQEMTPAFFSKMVTSVFVGVTQDYLTGDKSPEGLDSQKLIADLPIIRDIN